MKTCSLLLILFFLSLPCEARSTEFEGQSLRKFEGKSVWKYTREYKSDYGGFLVREEYHAYRQDLKDSEGRVVPAEVWHGPMTLFHTNTDKKRLQGNYRHGQRDGVFTFYSEEGQKALEWTYRSGESHGPVKYWNNQGKLISEGEYRDDKKFNGTFLMFDAKSHIRETYQDGKQIRQERIDTPW